MSPCSGGLARNLAETSRSCLYLLQANAMGDMNQALDFAKTGPDAQQVLVLGQANFFDLPLSQTELGWHFMIIGVVVLQY